jgi:hypothetical protein
VSGCVTEADDGAAGTSGGVAERASLLLEQAAVLLALEICIDAHPGGTLPLPLGV